MHNSYHSTTQHNHTSPKVGLSLSYIKLFLIFSKNENWWRYNTFRAYYLFFYLRNLFRICYLATSMVVEGANQYGANQYIFFKTTSFYHLYEVGWYCISTMSWNSTFYSFSTTKFVLCGINMLNTSPKCNVLGGTAVL